MPQLDTLGMNYWVLNLHIAVPLAIFVSLVACSTSKGPIVNVEFDQDVSLSLANEQEKTVKRGETIAISDEPLTVMRSGHKTVVLLPLPARPGKVQVRLPKEDATIPAASAGEKVDLGAEANRITQSVVAIQTLLAERRADEALVRIQALRERYPGFSYTRFLEASCFLVKGDVARAKSLTEAALRDFPDDATGRQFMAEISGATVMDEAQEAH